MEKQILDFVPVPLALLLMVAYHIWLLRQIVRRPTTTIVGINSINRRLWVLSMIEDASKNGVLAVQTLRNNIMASTVLASTAITLSSLIAVLMTSRDGPMGVVLGDVSELGLSIKFFSILLCFLLAFLFNVHSIRYYGYASVLINVPSRKMNCIDFDDDYSKCVTAENVSSTVNWGELFLVVRAKGILLLFPTVFVDLWTDSNVFLLPFADFHALFSRCHI